ncbi:MAG: amidase [Bacteroidales bacterium]|jgi:Asp-tRNA(Asn)/Glu-tRNA(Gln) amidotransferase A subunit family amidase|nr:amidase [Bacteroidales bacterium]
MKKLRRPLIIVLWGIICFISGAFVVIVADKIEVADVHHAQKLIGMEFTQAEADSMLPALNEQLRNYENMRKFDLPNHIPIAYEFNPIPAGVTFEKGIKPFISSDYSGTVMPTDINQLAFYSIGQLSWLIHKKKITSEKLTLFFLNRLKKYAPVLHCVVTYTEADAMIQAKKADEELGQGKDRGILHGIPFGIKDMFYTRNYPTTFGTPPYRNQVTEEDATIVEKLRNAGAVMIAKLSLGELAMDDVWFGGMTRNPWDTTKGSSGSSAGPASAVSAGLIPFAIGSETWGSIISPSTVCGVTGLRPTYGRVSRYGAMALSWTMDKVGPICRYTEDCAIVFNAIYGPDGKDQTVYDYTFGYTPIKDLKGLKIGYFPKDFDRDTAINKPFNKAALIQLEKMGAQLIPLGFPQLPYPDMAVILMAEAAAAFDELTLTNRDDLMVQQKKDRWPNLFRAAHFIPATEYIRANRIRYQLIQQMNKMMEQVDVCIAPSLAGDNLLVTNLTGHPSLVLPNGFINPKTPTSIVLIGQLFGEAKLLAIAKKYQDATGFHLKHPPLVN